GLVLDRQSNHGPTRDEGWCSTAATGMGLIAVALAAGPPYHLLTPAEAAQRVGAALDTALDRLPHHHGILPHFLDDATGEVCGTGSTARRLSCTSSGPGPGGGAPCRPSRGRPSGRSTARWPACASTTPTCRCTSSSTGWTCSTWRDIAHPAPSTCTPRPGWRR